MNDIEEFPVEPSRGASPPSELGERLMIGLAVAALLGGLLVATGNVLDHLAPQAAADVTGSPEPSTRPTRTARPSPSPRPPGELVVQPGPVPTPRPTPSTETLRNGFLLATAELVLRDAAVDAAAEVDRVPAGTVLQADEIGPERDWYQVFQDGAGRFVTAIGPDGTRVATFYSSNEYHFPGSVGGLIAGRDGFFALGWPAGSLVTAQGQYVIRSSDGASWSRVLGGPQASWNGWQAAWGPSGWIAVANASDDGLGLPFVWESADGERWTALGSLGDGPAFVSRLVGSEAGYLLQFGPGQQPESSLWFSRDGITWQESDDPFSERAKRLLERGDAISGLLATGSGFVAWATPAGPLAVEPEVAFSANGRTWTAIAFGDGEPRTVQFGAAGGRLIGIGLDAEDRTQAWSAPLADGGGMRLVIDRRLGAALAGRGVTKVVGSGERVLVTAFDPATGAPQLLVGDGAGWRELPDLPASFGTIPQDTAIGPAGIVLAGWNPRVPGGNPAIWHLRGDAWVAEADPVVRPIGQPSPGRCGEPPDNRAAFAALHSSMAVACFAGTPMTFVAWSALCSFCGDDPFMDRWEPAWLGSEREVLHLAPTPEEDGWWTQAVLHPDLEPDPAWTQAWVRVTGHYADPAAETCRMLPEPAEYFWYLGPRADAVTCRHLFVVTAVTVVDGPAG